MTTTDKYTPRHAKPGWNIEHTIYQRAFHEGIAARRKKLGITPRHAATASKEVTA